MQECNERTAACWDEWMRQEPLLPIRCKQRRMEDMTEQRDVDQTIGYVMQTHRQTDNKFIKSEHRHLGITRTWWYMHSLDSGME